MKAVGEGKGFKEQRRWASAAAALLQLFGKYLEMYIGGVGGVGV